MCVCVTLAMKFPALRCSGLYSLMSVAFPNYSFYLRALVHFIKRKTQTVE